LKKRKKKENLTKEADDPKKFNMPKCKKTDLLKNTPGSERK